MELTLRAAHKLVEKINGHIKTIPVDTTITVNTYEIDDAAAVFKQHLDTFNTNMERIGSLLEIRASLRGEIGEQNSSSAIDSLIANRKAAIERLQSYQRVYDNRAEGQIASAVALEKKIQADANRKTDSVYGRHDTISFTIITKEIKEQLAMSIAATKRTIEELEDQLLNLNVQRKIALAAEYEKILRKERLI